MIREITLGQYYSADSVIHRLDPRVKLAYTLIYIISLYVGKSFVAFAVAAAFLACVIALSKVPVRFMFRGLRSILFLLILSAVFNLFLVQGTVVFRIWKLQITKEGIETAILMVIRLILLVSGTSVMTLTTTPNDLTDGLEKGLGFLKAIKVPVHEIGMMMSIALRFIPILIEEVNKIMKAQEARGADFESGGLIQKAKAMIPLLIPLFVSAFRRANDLAQAMEARCYHGGDGRTKLHPLVYKKADYIAYAVLLLYLAVMIAIAVLFR
ncbi:MAG: energy-coupling factor transporter transmembrane protein EcfT [Lachnospiraceae bacterium]|nr:energy-coupling factor transporter transmembrane protein EcfT [Lachnospiraceae bacterium]